MPSSVCLPYAWLGKLCMRMAIAIRMTGFPSHAYGKQTLEGIARRLLRGLRRDSRPA